MSKGKAQVNYLHREGLVGNSNAPDWGFIYSTSLVKDPKWNVGDRVVLPDGREYRYAKSSAACTTNVGCEFTSTGYVSYTAFATNHAVGVDEITIPAATHAALTEDELRGGYVIIFDGAATSYIQFRGIIGNAAASANAAFKVQLDGPLTDAIVSGTEAVEVYQNPYSALRAATVNTYPKAGVPATNVSAASTYFWVQTKGLMWTSPQSGVGGSQGQHGAFWRHDGSIDKADTALATTVPAGSSSQYAGYCVEGSQAGNGPLFMLQG